MSGLLERLGIRVPIFQAPMAGVSTPALAAAVSNAGALGGIAVGASDAAGARAMIGELRGATARPFNVNVFVPESGSRSGVARRTCPDVPPLRSRTTSRSPADLPELQ